MQIDITIKNFRCFPDSEPARFSLRSGVTALVGKNNSGKSTILKFFYELRNLFGLILDLGNFSEAVRGNPRGFGMMPQVPDPSALFSDANDRPIVISVALPDTSGAKRMDIRLARNSNSFTLDIVKPDGSKYDFSKGTQWSG